MEERVLQGAVLGCGFHTASRGGIDGFCGGTCNCSMAGTTTSHCSMITYSTVGRGREGGGGAGEPLHPGEYQMNRRT